MSLQSQLTGLEEKINAARNNYNGRAREFNTSIAVFPNNVVASFFDVKPVVFFTEETAAQSVPKVKF
jgi:LemA protein